MGDGSNTDMLIPAQKAFGAATSNVGRLVNVVHVSSTQFWAVALAKAVVLCNEHGPVTTITGGNTSAGVPFASQAAHAPLSSNDYDHSGSKEGRSQAMGNARTRSASKAKEFR